jgi:hypothetical protein
MTASPRRRARIFSGTRRTSTSRSIAIAQPLRRLDREDPEPAARGLLAELRLPDQAAGRSVSGDPRGRDEDRANPEDLRNLYVKPDQAGDKLIPVRTMTKFNTKLGLQSVEHLNQFTSVTVRLSIRSPDVALAT